jgi:hypothetical protein
MASALLRRARLVGALSPASHALEADQGPAAATASFATMLMATRWSPGELVTSLSLRVRVPVRFGDFTVARVS